jgi:hypothetical protein
MRIVLFVHSLLADWNHGNAHFLRSVATELISRGHAVRRTAPIAPASASFAEHTAAHRAEELEAYALSLLSRVAA